MAQAKMMNEVSFAKLVKELSSVGELIRTRQEEKQAVIDEFEKERQRYKSGKISGDTMKSSSKKANMEFSRINKDIRNAISKSASLGMRIKDFIGNQSPKNFTAKVSGVTLVQTGSKKKVSKKSSKKKVMKKSSKISKTKIAQEIKAEKKLRR